MHCAGRGRRSCPQRTNIQPPHRDAMSRENHNRVSTYRTVRLRKI